MINLPDTSTKQGQRDASVLLARLMGWEVREWPTERDKGRTIIVVPGLPVENTRWADAIHFNLNFYETKLTGGEPVNMDLAWRVLNWAMTYPTNTEAAYNFKSWFQSSVNFGELMSLPPEKAVALWLDKIIEAADNVGLLDEDERRKRIAEEEQARIDNRRKRTKTGIYGNKLPMKRNSL